MKKKFYARSKDELVRFGEASSLLEFVVESWPQNNAQPLFIYEDSELVGIAQYSLTKHKVYVVDKHTSHSIPLSV